MGANCSCDARVQTLANQIRATRNELGRLIRSVNGREVAHDEDILVVMSLRAQIDSLGEFLGCPDCGQPFGQEPYCQGDGHAPEKLR